MSRFVLTAVLVASPAFADIDFARDVEPVFHERCYACHGDSQQQSGLRLDEREAALAGGYSGAVIEPGASDASKLMLRVSSNKEGFRMPPVGDPLSPAEIAVLTEWIDAGADWPVMTSKSSRLPDAERRKHWAFQAVKDVAPPSVGNSKAVRNEVDRFVLAKLEQEGVAPSPEADRVTLLRRAHFDLTGLPPSPEQAERFLSDDRPDAYERLVDELLRSPHYGERWALPWLDAARYADSAGYERDPLRPHAWRWRQWVIESLNRDKPFDEFTIEQIAGDLLPGATVEQRVATGFLRNGIKNREAGTKSEEKRFEEVLDRINTVGTVWLGLTVGCAQCHDHKFDPLSQKEFYQLFATFNNAVERDVIAPIPGQVGPYLRDLPSYRARRRQILEEYGVPDLQRTWREQMILAMDQPGLRTDWDHSVTEWRAANDRADWLMRSADDKLSELEREKITDWFVGRNGPDVSKDEEIKARLKEAAEKLAELRDELHEPSRAYTMVEREEPVATHIALRGDWRAPGVEVDPNPPSALPRFEASEEPARLRFARWIASKSNPLTARVTVNRIWQELFGAGLVRTPDDFGLQSEAPSHPELLDWLASEFVKQGWSQKRLIRLIMTSATYRQASNHRQDLAESDPENKLLARQSRLRLQAELLRDNALAVSGLLNPAVGGESIRPPQPAGIAELSYSKKAWEADAGPKRYRRGLYIFFRRTSPYPMLMNFDAPTTLVTAVRRTRSNTPLQALNLLNDPVFGEAAQALAIRALSDAEAPDARLDRMFRLCLSRGPEAVEKDRLATYLAAQRRIFKNEPEAARRLAPYEIDGVDAIELAAWTGLARGLMNLDEFLTRE